MTRALRTFAKPTKGTSVCRSLYLYLYLYSLYLSLRFAAEIGGSLHADAIRRLIRRTEHFRSHFRPTGSRMWQ